jgi:hypothetical protein
MNVIEGQIDSSYVSFDKDSRRKREPLNLIILCSLRFKIQVTFGHKLRYKIKFSFGEISFKLCQTNWNVAINNVNVVVDELPSQIIVYTCLTIDI